MKNLYLFAAVFASALSLFQLTGCGSAASVADISGDTGQAAIAATSGAVTSTAGDTSSRMLQQTGLGDDSRFVQCPTVHSGTTANCITNLAGADTVAAKTLALLYPSAGCIYGGNSTNKPIWSAGASTNIGVAGSSPAGPLAAFGGMIFNFTAVGGAATPVCGTGFFPKVDNVKFSSLTRNSVGTMTGTGTATTIGTATVRVSHTGTETLAMDTTNIAGYSFTPTDLGYTRTFVSAGTHQIKIGVRFVEFAGNMISAPTGKVKWDHTVSTSDGAGTSTPLVITVVPASGGTPETHSVSGSTYLQHNLAKFNAKATFTNLAHQIGQGCCFPTAGTMTLAFTGGANDGKTETFDFTSGAACTLATFGQFSFTDVKGVVSTGTLRHCM